MGAPATWTDLQTSVRNWLNRDTDGISDAQIQECIALAENRFNRTLLVQEREAEVQLSASTETVSLPADFWGVRSVYVNSTPRASLRQMSLSQIRDTYDSTYTSAPAVYAIQSASEMVLGPIPDNTYTLTLNYYQTIPALGAAQASNWLLTAYPDIYISGTLIEAYNFLRDAEGAVLYEQRLGRQSAEIMRASEARNDSGTPLIPRIVNQVWGSSA